MELRDFINEVLGQIAEGVIAAQAKYDAFGGMVNPGQIKDSVSSPYVKFSKLGSQALINNVDFEVVLSDVDETKTDGKAKARLGVFSLGGGVGTSDSHSQFSKVRFTIPVLLPRHPVKYQQTSR